MHLLSAMLACKASDRSHVVTAARDVHAYRDRRRRSAFTRNTSRRKCRRYASNKRACDRRHVAGAVSQIYKRVRYKLGWHEWSISDQISCRKYSSPYMSMFPKWRVNGTPNEKMQISPISPFTGSYQALSRGSVTDSSCSCDRFKIAPSASGSLLGDIPKGTLQPFS